MLTESEASMAEAVYAAGFSGVSRAQAGAPPEMAPKVRGMGERIGYFAGNSGQAGLGMLLVASTGSGVCAVLLGSGAEELVLELRTRFPAAEIWEDVSLSARLKDVMEPAAARELAVDMRGTAFQARVWAVLRAIPRGETRTYRQVAEATGNVKAVRAVARACAVNPMAMVVPCHRVIGSDGKLTGYRWGLERKRVLLALERATPVYG